MKRFPFKLTEYLQECDHARYQAAVTEDNATRQADARDWQAKQAAKAAARAEKKSR